MRPGPARAPPKVEGHDRPDLRRPDASAGRNRRDRRVRLAAAGRPGRRLSRGEAKAARDRRHRRLLLRRGVGRIFEAFRDGRLEDDDEVAIVQGPAEIGYLSASEAMVNFRSTFDVAMTDGVLSAASRQRLEAFVKSLYFADRTWSAVLEGAATRGVDRHELAGLRDWLPSTRVDQKRLDGLEMLAAIKAALAAPAPARPAFQIRMDLSMGRICRAVRRRSDRLYAFR